MRRSNTDYKCKFEAIGLAANGEGKYGYRLSHTLQANPIAATPVQKHTKMLVMVLKNVCLVSSPSELIVLLQIKLIVKFVILTISYI